MPPGYYIANVLPSNGSVTVSYSSPTPPSTVQWGNWGKSDKNPLEALVTGYPPVAFGPATNSTLRYVVYRRDNGGSSQRLGVVKVDLDENRFSFRLLDGPTLPDTATVELSGVFNESVSNQEPEPPPFVLTPTFVPSFTLANASITIRAGTQTRTVNLGTGLQQRSTNFYIAESATGTIQLWAHQEVPISPGSNELTPILYRF